jgi:hypothetical protein
MRLSVTSLTAFKSPYTSSVDHEGDTVSSRVLDLVSGAIAFLDFDFFDFAFLAMGSSPPGAIALGISTSKISDEIEDRPCAGERH